MATGTGISIRQLYGTRAERLAITSAGMFDEFYETDFSAVWQWVGSWRQKAGPSGTQHNRNMNAATAVYAESTNSVNWPVDVLVTRIITVSFPCVVVYGAPNAGAASTWLSDTGTASTDVAYDYVPANTIFIPELSVNPSTGAGFRRTDALPIGGASRIIISAVRA